MGVGAIKDWTLHIEGRSLTGRTVPQMLVMHDMKRALHTASILELNGYASCTSLPLTILHVDGSLAQDAIEDHYMGALRTIQRAFPGLKFVRPDTLDDDDYEFVMQLEQIVTTGEQVGTVEDLHLTLPASRAQYLPNDGLVKVIISQTCTATLWDTVINLGEASIDLGLLRIVQDVQSLKMYAAGLQESDSVPIGLRPAEGDLDRTVRRFKRFSHA